MIFNNVNNVVIESVGNSMVDNTNNSIHIKLAIDTLVLVEHDHHRYDFHLHDPKCPPVIHPQPTNSDDDSYSDCSLCRECMDREVIDGARSDLNGHRDRDSVISNLPNKSMKVLGNTGKRRLKTLKAFTKALKKSQSCIDL